MFFISSITVACLSHQCPTGSECKVCNATGLPYCEYSCTVDNGGCAEGSRCSLSQVMCPPDQCCSPSIACQCKFIKCTTHIPSSYKATYIATYS